MGIAAGTPVMLVIKEFDLHIVQTETVKDKWHVIGETYTLVVEIDSISLSLRKEDDSPSGIGVVGPGLEPLFEFGLRNEGIPKIIMATVLDSIAVRFPISRRNGIKENLIVNEIEDPDHWYWVRNGFVDHRNNLTLFIFPPPYNASHVSPLQCSIYLY